MPEHAICAGLLETPQEQHQTIKVCVRGIYTCVADLNLRDLHMAATYVPSAGRPGSGKSTVIAALQAHASADHRSTLGLQVCRSWKSVTAKCPGLHTSTLNSLIEFWEVRTLLQSRLISDCAYCTSHTPYSTLEQSCIGTGTRLWCNSCAD